jgi:hypothetical protein
MSDIQFRAVTALEGAVGRALTEVASNRVVPESSSILVSAIIGSGCLQEVLTADGRTTVVGRDGLPVAQAVAQEIAQPKYAGLLSAPPPTQAQAQAQSFGRPLSQQEQISSGLLSLGLGAGTRTPLQPGQKSAGEHLIDHANSLKPTTNPALDMNRSFGLKGTGR